MLFVAVKGFIEHRCIKDFSSCTTSFSISVHFLMATGQIKRNITKSVHFLMATGQIKRNITKSVHFVMAKGQINRNITRNNNNNNQIRLRNL